MATNYDTRMALLENLARRVERAAPGEVTPATIAPIFRYFDPARIPTSARPSPAERRQVKLTNAALRVLAACGSEQIRPGSPALVKRILAPDGWPNIWKWMQFEHDKCIVKETYGEDGRYAAVIAITFTLGALSECMALRNVVRSMPGLLVLVTKQWLLDRSPEFAYHTRVFAVTLEMLLDRDAEEVAYPPTHEVLDGAGGDATLIATTALTRLRAAMAAGVLEDVGVYLSLIHSLSCVSCRPLHLAFINGGSIPETIQVLSWSNARAMDGLPADTIVLCYESIINGFYSTNGSAWAVQALDSGLLTAMLRSGAWIGGPDHGNLVEIMNRFLTELLPKYLIFRSVLRALRKSIRQAKKLGLATEASTGPLWKAWRFFEELAEERLCLLDAWDKEGGRTALQTCSRTQCSKYDDETMKRCSGCLGPLYCSKECQRLAWPLHKRACKEARKMFSEGSRVPRDKLDESFIQYLTDDMAYRHIPGIVLGAIDSGISPTALFLEIDHTVVPSACHLRGVCNYRPPTEESAAEYDWQDMLRRAEASCGTLMAIRTLVPHDENEVELLISLIDTADALVKSLLSGFKGPG